MDNRQTSSLSNEDIPTTVIKPGGKSVAILALRENREREKRELSELNDRFASYIGRVRFLEGLNKELQLELDHLKEKWGLNTNAIKEKYHTEIHQVRQTIDDTAKDCAVAELRAKRAEEETIKLKEKCELLSAGRDSDRTKIELLEKQLSVNEADLDLFHHRLIDLEDERKRAQQDSQQLMLDIQRITKDLDQEILIRIGLENEKQTLEDEIYFLKKIHAEEVQELQQLNIVGTEFDPTKFFQNELSHAVRNIREEYQQLNQQQRTELQTWYQSKVTQAIQEIQSHRTIAKSENTREQEEVKKLRTLATDAKQETMAIRRRNGELENRVRALEEMLGIERNKNLEAMNQRDRKIEHLTIDLKNLRRNYDELITTKSSLDSEISIYRKLLEGVEKREGLKELLTNVQQTNSATTFESTVYSRFSQRTNDSQELEERSSTGHEYSSSGGKYPLSAKSSKSDQYTRRYHDIVPSFAVHEKRARIEDSSDSSDEHTDYDSSIEDPNERLDRFLAFNRKNS